MWLLPELSLLQLVSASCSCSLAPSLLALDIVALCVKATQAY